LKFYSRVYQEIVFETLLLILDNVNVSILNMFEILLLESIITFHELSVLCLKFLFLENILNNYKSRII